LDEEEFGEDVEDLYNKVVIPEMRQEFIIKAIEQQSTTNRKEYMKKYYQENKDKFNKYYEENKEKRKEYAKRYYLKNKKD